MCIGPWPPALYFPERYAINFVLFTQGRAVPLEAEPTLANLIQFVHKHSQAKFDLEAMLDRAKTFALIADDPDAPAGTWVHWVIFNIPGQTQSLPSGVEKKEQLAGGSKQGKNDFRKIGYNGPCPPLGKPHRYFFKLYALGSDLTLPAGASKADVEHAMAGHILAQAELMGRYKR